MAKCKHDYKKYDGPHGEVMNFCIKCGFNKELGFISTNMIKKRKSTMAKSEKYPKKLFVSLTVEEHRKFRIKAASTGYTGTEIVRQMITNYTKGINLESFKDFKL